MNGPQDIRSKLITTFINEVDEDGLHLQKLMFTLVEDKECFIVKGVMSMQPGDEIFELHEKLCKVFNYQIVPSGHTKIYVFSLKEES